jgi:phage terminase large subunit-like protein
VGGTYEDVCHLTGLYPDWWEGHRFDHPVSVWVAGDTAKTVRDILQKELMGEPGDPGAQGTGMVPGDLILDTTPKQGTPNAFETVYVKHVTGGTSVLQFKSYDQGRVVFQGTSQDLIHLDEECPMDIWTECLLRTMTTHGLLYLTATPLEGLTDLLLAFLPQMRPESDEHATDTNKHTTFVSWEDVPHLDEAQKAKMMASIPPWQRASRMKGIPQLGSGAIYTEPEDNFVIAPIEIPRHWKRCIALDVGWNTTAVLWGAIDPETNTVYITHELYKHKTEPTLIVGGIKVQGDWIPGVIDPAARGRSQIDGRKLMDIYTKEPHNLDLRPAVNAVEAGLVAVWELLTTGQLKVFKTCTNLLSEYRLYRRDKNGKIVKAHDHAMDALRYLIMSGRDRAVVAPATGPNAKRWFDWSPRNDTWAG